MNTKSDTTKKVSARQNGRKAIKHTDDLYDFVGQLFRAHDAETPTQYAKEAYDRTECGVWTAFVLADGSAIPSHDLGNHRDTVEWASRHVVGIKHGTIVEGSDAEFEADILYFSFSDQDLAVTWQYLQDQVSRVNAEESEEISRPIYQQPLEAWEANYPVN